MQSGWMVTMLAVMLIGLVAPTTVRAQKPPDALESIDAEWSGIQTDLLEVKRMSDNTVRVRWRWRNTTDKTVQLLSSSDAAKALKEGAYLIDGKNRRSIFPSRTLRARSSAPPSGSPLSVQSRPSRCGRSSRRRQRTSSRSRS